MPVSGSAISSEMRRDGAPVRGDQRWWTVPFLSVSQNPHVWEVVAKKNITHHTPHTTTHTTHTSPHNTQHNTQHTQHTTHTSHNTQHTTHNTQYTIHSTQHTAHSTPHTAHNTHNTHNTPHTTHHTPHTTHHTPHTPHPTPHTPHHIPHSTHHTTPHHTHRTHAINTAHRKSFRVTYCLTRLTATLCGVSGKFLAHSTACHGTHQFRPTSASEAAGSPRQPPADATQSGVDLQEMRSRLLHEFTILPNVLRCARRLRGSSGAGERETNQRHNRRNRHSWSRHVPRCNTRRAQDVFKG